MQKGIIKKWQADRGFGFITTNQGDTIFFHVSDYHPKSTPKAGEEVVFKLEQDKKGRTQAKKVQSAQFAEKQQAEYEKRQQKRDKIQADQQSFEFVRHLKLLIATCFYFLLASLVAFHYLPWVFFAWYIVCGVLTFGLYAKDKEAAEQREWRTKENTLHTMAIIGGWVGAMIAHAYLRHKSQKTEFRAVYYCTILLNLTLLGGYLYFQSMVL